MVRWIFQNKPKRAMPFLTRNIIENSLPQDFGTGCQNYIWLNISQRDVLVKAKNTSNNNNKGKQKNTYIKKKCKRPQVHLKLKMSTSNLQAGTAFGKKYMTAFIPSSLNVLPTMAGTGHTQGVSQPWSDPVLLPVCSCFTTCGCRAEGQMKPMGLEQG